MKIIVTENQFEKNRPLINVINLSDLRDADTWSPKTFVQKKEGRDKYYFEDDQFVKTPKLKSSKLYFLSNKVAELLNDRIKQTKEKYSEYIKFKETTDTLLKQFSSDDVKYKRGL
jgi:hypothetical protein